MNVGQLLETMLGWAAKTLDIQTINPVFDSATEEEIHEKVREAKKQLRDRASRKKYLPSRRLPHHAVRRPHGRGVPREGHRSATCTS